MADVQSVTYNGFGGGINTRVPAADIADNEVVDALNLELDRQAALRSRGGTQRLIDGTGGGLPGRVTSMVYFRTITNTDCVIFTAGNKVYRMAPGGSSKVDLSSTLTLPTDTQWQWAIFENQAIGVNRATTGDNPIIVASPGAAAATALGGTVPRSRYVAAWNYRLWFVSEAEPNRLYWTALGTTNDVTTAGTAGGGSMFVGGNEGDAITCIIPHLDRLFVFKRNKTYVVNPGSPNTDALQFEVQRLSSHIGCISAYTVQVVQNDLIFLSDAGVQSLQSVMSKGDSDEEAVPISVNVVGIDGINKAVETYASAVHPERLQYWLSAPSGGSSTNSDVFVMDYSQVDRGGGAAWTRFDGLAAGSAYAVVLESGKPYIYVGMASGIYRYGASGVYTDNGAAYKKQLITKAHSAGQLLWRKDFIRFGWEFSLDTNTLSLLISPRVDEKESQRKNIQIAYSGNVSGALWDVALFDAGVFSSTNQAHVEFVQPMRGATGRRGQTLQFIVTNTAAEGFSIKRLSLDVVLLTRRWVGDFTLTDPRKP